MKIVRNTKGNIELRFDDDNTYKSFYPQATVDILDANRLALKLSQNGEITVLDRNKITATQVLPNAEVPFNPSTTTIYELFDLLQNEFLIPPATSASGENVVVVSKTGGGDFTEFKPAVEYAIANGASPSNPWTVRGMPGVYSEDTITLAPGIFVVAEVLGSVIITPNDPTQPIFYGADQAALKCLVMTGANGVGGRAIEQISTNGIGLLVRDCNFSNNTMHVYNNANGGINSLVYIDRCSATQDCVYGFYTTNDGSAKANTIFTNGVYKDLIAPSATQFIFAENPGTLITITNTTFRGSESAATECITLQNGAEVHLLSCTIRGFDYGVRILNTGDPSKAVLNSLSIFDSGTYDIEINHPLAIGSFNGDSSHEKIYSVAPNFVWMFLDNEDGELEFTGTLAVRYPNGVHTDLSTLLIEGSGMGLFEGGDMNTTGTPFEVLITEGFGYLETVAPDQPVRIDWTDTTLVIPANQDVFVFFNQNGILSIDGAKPNPINAVIIGRVVTSGTDIRFIENAHTLAEHFANRLDNLLTKGVGPIYVSGSTVTENATPLHLNVSGGDYFYGSNEFLPAGGNNINFIACYGGNAQAITNAITLSYDNAGTLTPIPAGRYAKHSLYVVGEDAAEKYFLVYATTTYATLLDAQNADIPLAPTFIRNAVCLIAGIIVKEGTANIVDIRDLRPRVGFKVEGSTASAEHASLLGLTTGDAGHTQFLMRDGSKKMTGDLDADGNKLKNVSQINTIDPANWFKNGAQSLGANQVIGAADNFRFSIKTNNTERVVVSNTGLVKFSAYTAAGKRIAVLDTDGTLSDTGVNTDNLSEGSTNLYHTDARVRATVLTGFVAGSGTVVATDSVLQAIQKLAGNVGAVTIGSTNIVSGTVNRVLFHGASDKVQESANLTFDGTTLAANQLTIGTGATVKKILTATATLDFPNTIFGNSNTLTISVPGALVGDTVMLGLPASPHAGVFAAYVSAADTVTVRYSNFTPTPQNPVSATYRVTIIQF